MRTIDEDDAWVNLNRLTKILKVVVVLLFVGLIA